MLASILIALLPPSTPSRHPIQILVSGNDHVRLTINLTTGKFDLAWKGLVSIKDAYGEVRLEGGKVRKTSEYATHQVQKSDIKNIRDALGNAVQVTLHHRSPGQPELRHTFWFYMNRPEVIVRLDAVGKGKLGSNYLAPIVSKAAFVGLQRGSIQSLFVPYDNDNYFRYRSDGWGDGLGDGDGSYEVGAVFDAKSRRGFVVGSIEHDTWKSAVRFKKADLSFRAYSGVSSKYTHDKEPHGTVSGREVHSAKISLGAYTDWRQGLETYGSLNALIKPALPWKGSPPVGWNSWSAYKTKLTEAGANAALDFVHNELSELRSGRTAYINLDSFWDNLSKEARLNFVKRAHLAGLKAGIYWTPFVAWGNLKDHVNGRQDPMTYQDLVIKDAKGEPLPRLDGGWPLDPTHPGTLSRIDRQMAEFVNMGFDFVKLDFMTHGSLEGRHFDPMITTGTAAYAKGMQRILDSVSEQKIGKPFFISLSIAPMFPHGYAHSRRISCDVFANIGASEYLLNSTTFGWWTNNTIYRFNDPDSSSVYQPLDEPVVIEAEGRTRITASVISGGMIFAGDDVTKPGAQERLSKLFSNREVLALANRAPAFRPVEGDSQTKATNSFTWRDAKNGDTYLALFNYDGKADLNLKVDLQRTGLDPRISYSAHNLWTGTNSTISKQISVKLPPCSCALLRLSANRLSN